ncbi:hypothetical protein OGAPHI_000844 [Ogataea philodendri]|uniref:Uncharacterized protein n=1 Tax=Ogataea philodendri TaxID=1378263 RepID=A0A9P8T9A2_9ASCO|nr:uncharacterized protein OGAPHI_000844 [Ogataea philodendri]KAH3671133.1 hypothetical protein OGAPHI_000844 [Ogataea philodendri]
MSELHDQIIFWEEGGKHLDFLAERGHLVVKVEEHGSLSDQGGEGHEDVGLSKTSVHTGSKHKPILWSVPCWCSLDPSFWNELVWVLVDFRVVQSRIHGWNHHGSLWHSVVFADWVCLLGDVRNHDHRWSISEGLSDDHVGVLHLVN